MLDETSNIHSPNALSTSLVDSTLTDGRSESLPAETLSNEAEACSFPGALSAAPPVYPTLAGEMYGGNTKERKMLEYTLQPISAPLDSTPLGPSHPRPKSIEGEPNMVEIDAYKHKISMLGQLNEAVLRGDTDKFSLKSSVSNPQMRCEPEVAHIAARLGLRSILELLSSQFRNLSSLPNSRGDTPLHVAARAGQLEIVNYFLDPQSRDLEMGGWSSSGEEIDLSMKNMKGNTALHEALENKQEQVARLLVKKDPKLLYLPNTEGKTPEYLAAEAGLLQLLEDMWELPGKDFILPQCEAMTALHAAVIRRHRESIEWVLERKPQLARVADINGRNPLHYVASIGYYEGLNELLRKDTQAAYQPDRLGHYPIHEAASAGHINIIQLLLERCPGSWALPGKGGQSILHVAALQGNESVVRYILKTRDLETLINDLDVRGNTPLHLATDGSHYKAVRALTGDNRVNMSISNNDNLTALDIAEKNFVKRGPLRKLLTLTTLRIANAPRARNLELHYDKDREDYVVNPPKAENLKDTVNILLLVSTLVATVTFAAGFTIPGGLTSDGTATMLSNSEFKAFVICDAIALFCSILAVISLIWAQLGYVSVIKTVVLFTILLLGISLSMMVIAFSAGLYIVTSGLHWLASFVLIMMAIFLICILIVLLPLRMQLLTRNRIMQRISYYFFYLLASATGGDSDGRYDIRKDYVWKEEQKGK